MREETAAGMGKDKNVWVVDMWATVIYLTMISRKDITVKSLGSSHVRNISYIHLPRP